MLNFCKVIAEMLKETAKDGTPEGADIFFPCTIYAMLKMKRNENEQSNSTTLLKSNLVYIRNFRFESLLHGEEDYYLQTLESAIEFI